jgi:hypothetical protein
MEGLPVKRVLACFLTGLAWAWAEQRDFLLVFGAFALSCIAIGLCLPDAIYVAGGLAILALLASACTVYGSQQ